MTSELNDVRGFEVFKSTAECIFKCETTKMKLAKIMDFHAETLLDNVIFYQLRILFKFLKVSYVFL